MTFAAPFWLVGLVPWAAVTIWLLWGRRPRRVVPFLPLWQGTPAQAKRRRAVQMPPLALAAAVLALLLAVVGAAAPTFVAGHFGVITVIVDRGATMSGKVNGVRRYADAAQSTGPRLRTLLGPGPVRLIDLPGGTEHLTDRDHWASIAASLPPTAAETAASIQATVLARLRDSTGPIVVLTDQMPDLGDERLAVVPPAPPPPNVGIVSMAARELPTPEVMVRLRSDGVATGRMAVRSNGQEIDRTVEWTSTSDRDVFVSLPGPAGEVIEAEWLAEDGWDLDNRAWLVRGHGRPRLEPRSPLPEALRRMVAVYQRAVPSGEGAATVTITTEPALLRGMESGVIFSPPVGGAVAATRQTDGPRVVPDAITASVDWRAVVRDATVAAAPPAGWTPLISIGDRVLVARRAEPARQVWVGFDSPTWPRTADFVVFWANVFDWVGGRAGATFGSEPVQPLGSEWLREGGPAPASTPPGLWPGVYRGADGARRAINARAVAASHTPAKDWQSRLLALSGSTRVGTPLAPPIFLAAIACGAVAAMSWSASRPPAECSKFA